jgi:hypothetical protein
VIPDAAALNESIGVQELIEHIEAGRGRAGAVAKHAEKWTALLGLYRRSLSRWGRAGAEHIARIDALEERRRV